MSAPSRARARGPMVDDRKPAPEWLMVWCARQIAKGMALSSFNPASVSSLVQRGFVDAKGELTEAGRNAAGGSL